MNKVELIKAVAEATNNTQKDIKVIMEAVQDVTYGALVEGDEVKLMDGVTLSVVHKVARNPRTGESVEVDAKNAVKCKFGKAIKDAVNA